MCTRPKRPSLRQRLFTRIMAGMDASSQEKYQEKKRQLLSPLRGTVVEVGPGTGVNLQFIHGDARWIGLEPNEAMHPFLREKAGELGMEVQLVSSTLEDSGLEDGSVDAVIDTLVLCSVPSVPRTLERIRRLLKPGGKYVFIEHVGDKPWTFRRFVQKALPYTPWWYFSDGCNPGRDIADDIAAAGFSRVDCESYMQVGSGIIAAIGRPHIFGTAWR